MNYQSNTQENSDLEHFHLQLFSAEGEMNRLPERFIQSYIHLLFCLEGEIQFQFSPMYSRSLREGMVFMVYQPDRDLSYKPIKDWSGKVVWLSVSIETLHSLFVPDANSFPLMNPEFTNRVYYEEKRISAELYPVLQSIHHFPSNQNAQRLYFKAKAMELMSLFFSSGESQKEGCPFLNDEETVRKIKQAKTILMDQYANPPLLTELAKQIQLNEFQLKTGFKQVYGTTPYQFVLEYKLELAKRKLQTAQYSVNEVADSIGYTNVSHFIEAFKRKYGSTPKKLIPK
ncbi:MAG TPA: AraC family transcriptional regulator [Saprospiraceae bacterium]|nr:AraC family transcriptional regulator [Saprospiraceae bacterium]